MLIFKKLNNKRIRTNQNNINSNLNSNKISNSISNVFEKESYEQIKNIGTNLDKFTRIDKLNDWANDDYQKVYCSMGSTTTRIMNDDIFKVFDTLIDQTLQFTKIFLSIPKKDIPNIWHDDELEQRIEMIEKLYPTIICIRSNDYGKSTKLLGVLEWIENMTNKSISFNQSDIFVVVDDEMLYSNTMVEQHLTSYYLYGCDCCAVDEEVEQSYELYRDEYDGYLNGRSSFSIQYKSTKKLITHYHMMINLIPSSYYDEVFTSYMRINGLYCVESTQPSTIGTTLCTEVCSISEHDMDCMRNNLSHKIREKVDLELKHQYNSVKYIVPNYIGKRFIQNVENIEIKHDQYHVMTHYVDESRFLLTICFNENQNNPVILIITYCDKSFYLEITMRARKQTHLINTTEQNILLRPVIPIKSEKYKMDKIMQTYESNEMNRNKFYSIQTIIGNAPDYEYYFFDKFDRESFIRDNFKEVVLMAYHSIVPNSYKADLFRYCWLLINGGVYFDCKMLLCCPLDMVINRRNEYFDKKDDHLFVKDLIDNYCYNAFIICEPMNEVLKLSINRTIKNIIKCNKTKDPLSVTGPGILGNAIEDVYGKKNYKYYYFKKDLVKSDFSTGMIYDIHNKMIIKCAYQGYYDESNYLKKSHYSVLWHNNNLFTTETEEYVANELWRFKGIDCIAWINLNRALDRRNRMNKLLSMLDTCNQRIVGIDGRIDFVNSKKEFVIPLGNESSELEVACCMSHLKAHRAMLERDGNVFLILEDDMNVNFTPYLNNEVNIEHIIESAPYDWEIIMLQYTYEGKLYENYTDWNREYELGNYIFATGAYLINRKGLNKSCKLFQIIERSKSYVLDRFEIYAELMVKYLNRNVIISDISIYRNLRTYCYKYAMFTCNNLDTYVQTPMHLKLHEKTQNIVLENLLEEFDPLK